MFIEKNKKVIYIITSIILTIGLNMLIDVAQNKIYFNGNEIVWLMICTFLFIALKKASEYKEKRLNVCSIVLGIVLSIFQILGIMTKGNWIAHEVIISKTIVLFITIKLIIYTITFTSIIKIILKYLENIKLNQIEGKDIFKPTLKTFFIVIILFMIAWMPYFLNYYPGITSFDTNYQLMQGYGRQPYSNHHPVLHTIIITVIVKIGYAITNNYNFGIALCSIIQMIACATTFSFVIYYMGKKEINPIIKMLTFIFFAFAPFVPQFSIAIWKDVPFALCMVWFTIAIIEIIINEEKILKNIKYNALIMILITLLMFFRNNGVYIVLLTLPCLIILKRKYWKRELFLFLIPIIIYYIITGPIYSKLNIAKSASREMLSIPIQQMARIVTYKSDELTKKEIYTIAQYIPVERVAELYNPTIADPIKNEFNEGTLKQDKLNFIKLYIKLSLKFPGETLEAFVGNTYGYYYPEVVTYAIATGTYTSPFENEKFMDIHLEPIIKIPFVDSMVKAIYDKEIPIVSLIANIGFVFWVFMLGITYCIYQKKYPCLLMYIPIAVLYLTCLASPVSGELRYIYSMFVCLPLIIGFSLNMNVFAFCCNKNKRGEIFLKKDTIKKIIIVIALMLMAYFIGTLCRSNPLSNVGPGTDSSVFTYIANQMNKGKMPYLDCFDHKGPILYIINWIGIQLNFVGINGIWILEYISFFITILFTQKILKKVFNMKDVEALILNFLTNVNIIFFLEGGNLTEQFALPVITIALYKMLTLNKINLKKSNVLIGMLLAIVVAIRLNMIVLWIIYYIYTFIKCIKDKKMKTFLEITIYSLLGFLSVVGILSIYLIQKGIFLDCINDYLLFNLKYAIKSHDKITEVIKYFVINSNYFLYLIIVVQAYITKDAKFKKFSILYTIMTWIIVIQPKNKYLHYGLILVPTFIIPLANFFLYIKEKIKNKEIRIFMMIVLILIQLMLPIESYTLQYFTINIKSENNEEIKTEVIEYIKETSTKSDKILVVGNHCEIYLLTNREAGSKYQYQYPIYKVEPKILEETISDIKSNEPKYILYNSNALNSDLEDIIKNETKEDYKEIKRWTNYELYERKEIKE